MLLTDEPITLPKEIASLYNTKKGYKIVHSVTPLPLVEAAAPRPVSPTPQVKPPIPPHEPPTAPLPFPVPCSPVRVPAMLWLSKMIVEWKFLGRYLGLSEADLTRIELENPRNIAEQTYQMLETWSRQTNPENFNYQVLCEKLMEAETNKDLCDQFVTYINEIEES